MSRKCKACSSDSMNFCSIYVPKSMFGGYSLVPACKAEKGTHTTSQFSSDSMSSAHLRALAGYTFTKFINELGKLIYGDGYTKTNNADTCIKSEYQQQLQSGGDPWS